MRSITVKRSVGGVSAVGLAMFWAGLGQSTPSALLAGPQIVGPSVMLRVQREGGAVFDLRASGRRVPGAMRVPSPSRLEYSRVHAIALIAEPAQAISLLKQAKVRADELYIIPPSMLEDHTRPGVPQWSVAQLRAGVARVQVIDVSEAEEFAYARIPGSRRVAYEALRGGDLSAIARSCPVAVI